MDGCHSFYCRGGDGIDGLYGSGESVDRTIAIYADLIYRVAFHYLKNQADAEDIAHDVLIKWMEKAPVFFDDSHEKAWFIRVTVNACKDLCRSAWRRQTVDMDSCPDIPSPSQHSLLQEVLALPPDYSTVIYLHYFEGYSVREIAQILHIHERAVQSRLYRARQQLKRGLEELCNA